MCAVTFGKLSSVTLVRELKQGGLVKKHASKVQLKSKEKELCFLIFIKHFKQDIADGHFAL